MKINSSELFKLDSDQKSLISDISSLCGIKQETIKLVWEYTFFLQYLNLLDNKNKSICVLNMPFIGKIIARYNEQTKDIEDEKWALVSDQVIDLIKDIKQGNKTGMIKYLEENFINKVIEQYE